MGFQPVPLQLIDADMEDRWGPWEVIYVVIYRWWIFRIYTKYGILLSQKCSQKYSHTFPYIHIASHEMAPFGC